MVNFHYYFARPAQSFPPLCALFFHTQTHQKEALWRMTKWSHTNTTHPLQQQTVLFVDKFSRKNYFVSTAGWTNNSLHRKKCSTKPESEKRKINQIINLSCNTKAKKKDERIIAAKTPKMTYFHRPSIAVSLLLFSQILPAIIANPMAVVVAPSATTAALQQQQAAAAAAAAVSSTDKRQAGRHSEKQIFIRCFSFDFT